MTTTRIGDRLKSYFVAEAGCRFHDRFWIGCQYCDQGRKERFGLAAERRHVAQVAETMKGQT